MILDASEFKMTHQRLRINRIAPLAFPESIICARAFMLVSGSLFNVAFKAA